MFGEAQLLAMGLNDFWCVIWLIVDLESVNVSLQRFLIGVMILRRKRHMLNFNKWKPQQALHHPNTGLPTR